MRKKLTAAFVALVVIGGSATMLTACNTVAGAGKDVSNAGHTVTKAADENK